MVERRGRQPGRHGSFRRGAGSVVRIDGLELPILLDHGMKDPSIKKLCFLDDAPHHLLGRSPQLALDERHHSNIAFDLDVVTKVKTIARGSQGTQANL